MNRPDIGRHPKRMTDHADVRMSKGGPHRPRLTHQMDVSESTQPDVGRGQIKVPWCLLKPLEFFCGYVDCKGFSIISFEFCADHLQAE